MIGEVGFDLEAKLIIWMGRIIAARQYNCSSSWRCWMTASVGRLRTCHNIKELRRSASFRLGTARVDDQAELVASTSIFWVPLCRIHSDDDIVDVGVVVLWKLVETKAMLFQDVFPR
jgi:hypothetical protein